jgi:protein O-GlcNAc transferase
MQPSEKLAAAIRKYQEANYIESEQLSKEILETDQNNIRALNLLGMSLHEQGLSDKAISALEKAIEISPEYFSAHNNKAIVYYEKGLHDLALRSADQAIHIKPDAADVYVNKAQILYALGQYEDSIACAEKSISLDRAEPRAYSCLGAALSKLGRNAQALTNYSQAVSLGLRDADTYNNRGITLRRCKRYREALADFDTAIAIAPDYAGAYSNRGNVLRDLNRYEEALIAYDKALALKPDLAEAWLGRGHSLLEFRRYGDALAAYDKALALNTSSTEVEGLRLFAKMHLCDWNNFDAECAHLVSSISHGIPAAPPLVLLAVPSSSAEQLSCAKLFGAENCPASVDPIWKGEKYNHDRIRIAYLSADFRDHPISYLVAGMFERHDKSRFEIAAISFGPDQPSNIRRRLKGSLEHFIDARSQSDEETAKLIRHLEIDIVVDLMGYTTDSRLNIFAQRPGPIQVSYLGYIGSMGADFIDYVIADKIALPLDQQPFYSEKIVHLPDSFLVNDNKLAISPHIPSRKDAGLPADGFVFCSFNNSYKINAQMFDVWMRLLHQIEGSVLWLFGANPAAVANLRSEGERRGVDSSRLVFAARVDLADHLARHSLADVFLDTVPYNAGATGSAALWSGLPVLTCRGDSFVGRMGASMLNAVGLPELVANNIEAYEALALKLARDSSLLASFKDKLARNRDSYPLFNTERFTRQIEAAYTTMWKRHKQGEPPVSFSIDPSL